MKLNDQARLKLVSAPVLVALALLSLLPLSPARAQTATADYTVSPDWTYTPAGLQPGDSFRLLFMTSSAHSAMSVSEQDYIGVVKGRADANAALKPYKDAFRALISTQYHDARDLTRTTYTNADKGLPIYWLNGDKVADNYADFYDGSWDSHAARDEAGAVVHGLETRHIWTGSGSDGTKKTSQYLSAGTAAIGKLAGDNGGAGKEIDSGVNKAQAESHHFYALSPVFTVAGHQVPAGGALVPAGLQSGDSFRLLFVTSTTRNSEPDDIGEYNAFVERAANQNSVLEPYDFRVVGSTEGVDARGNTGTTGTGVPIYWVSGEKVADDYGDFYDGTWDSYAKKDQHGNSITPSVIATGSNNDGTRTHRFLGQDEWITYGHPSDGHVLRSSNNIVAWHSPVHFYALSVLFTVSMSAPAPQPTATPVPTATPTPTPTATPSAPLPAVNLNTAPSSISENGGVSTISAWLYKPASETITITISAVDRGTGEVNADLYTLSANRTLTIAAGETSSTGVVTLSAVDNTRRGTVCCSWQNEVSVIVSGAVAGSARPVSDAWVIIMDDEPVGGL